jgi:hypothetical protein
MPIPMKDCIEDDDANDEPTRLPKSEVWKQTPYDEQAPASEQKSRWQQDGISFRISALERPACEPKSKNPNGQNEKMTPAISKSRPSV